MFVSFLLLQPRISIVDIDAIVYSTGAKTFQAGITYPSATWPPGYSFVLSFGADPIAFARVVNGAALGTSVAIVFLFIRQNGWNWYTSLGFSLAFGFGFFRSIAQFAKPDIFTFAVFLLGAYAYSSTKRSVRFLAYVFWSLLILFKLVAVVFVPAGILVELWLHRRNLRVVKWLDLVFAGLLWALALASLLLFNWLNFGVFIGSNHPVLDIQRIPNQILQFFGSIFRQFLTSWYGTIQHWTVIVPFVAVALLGVLCLLTLRPARNRKRLLLLALAVFSLSWALIFVRRFDTEVRTLGYALVIVLVCFQPRKSRFSVLWLVYAAATILFAVYNVLSVDRFGVNDPRYDQIARNIAAQIELPPGQTIYSNATYLLQVRELISTSIVEGADGVPLDSLQLGDYLLLVDMPNYDAIMRSITPITLPEGEWCKISEIENAILWQKCNGE